MPAKRGTVHIAEDIERSGRWLTGTFRASWQTSRSELESLDDVGVDDAIAWALERSDRVMVRLGAGDHFWAGVGPPPHDTPPWPPADLPTIERRRHPAFAYLDRTPDDPPIWWAVTAWLGPHRDASQPRGVWEAGLDDAVLDMISEQAGAQWDDESRREMARDMEKARRAAKRRGSDEYGWTTSGRDAYRLRWRVSAATERQAQATAAGCLALPADLVLEDLTVAPSA